MWCIIQRLRDAGQAVDVAGEAPERRIVNDAAQVAFEVPVVHGVEARRRGEQPDVGFGEAFAEQVARPRQPCFQPVERLEQRYDRFLVCCLRGGEAPTVDAVVHVR